MEITKPWLCPALDSSDVKENLRDAEQIADLVEALKVNDDAVDDSGLADLVRPLLEFGKPLFVDMKMDKGSRTMAERARKATGLGVTLINAYVRADRLLKGPVSALEGTQTKLLGVTVLTHHGEEYCQEYYRRSLLETVQFLSKKAVYFGLHGITLPVPTLSGVRDLQIIKATPGIRPKWAERSTNNQESTGTPTEAIVGGSNILICGSPWKLYPDGPRAGIKRIKEEMQEAWEVMISER